MEIWRRTQLQSAAGRGITAQGRPVGKIRIEHTVVLPARTINPLVVPSLSQPQPIGARCFLGKNKWYDRSPCSNRTANGKGGRPTLPQTCRLRKRSSLAWAVRRLFFRETTRQVVMSHHRNGTVKEGRPSSRIHRGPSRGDHLPSRLEAGDELSTAPCHGFIHHSHSTGLKTLAIATANGIAIRFLSSRRTKTGAPQWAGGHPFAGVKIIDLGPGPITCGDVVANP